MAEPGQPTTGDLIAGRYQLEDRLGQGGMAVVYRARHVGTGKACAVKFLLPQLVEDDKQREQFLREAQVAGRIDSHPNIVDVFDTGLDPVRGVPYIAMELLRGEPLSRYAKKHAPLPWQLAGAMLEQIGDALDAAHAVGVVHRDLKPGNVFVSAGRKGELVLKVLDFGIAKVVEGMMDGQTATQVGTPWYSAPEQLGSSMRQLAADRGITVAPTVSAATDVWALCLIAFELLSGVSPKHYWGTQTLVDQLVKLTLEQRVAPSARVGDRAGCLPPGFDDWFLCCTRHNAAERYRSAGQAVAALVAMIQTAGMQPLAAPPPAPSSRVTALGLGPAAGGPATPSSPSLGAALGASGAIGAGPSAFGRGTTPPSGPLAVSGPMGASAPALAVSAPMADPELAPTAYLSPNTSPSAMLDSLGGARAVPGATGPFAPGTPRAGAVDPTGSPLGQSGPLGTTGSARMADTHGSWQQDAAAAGNLMARPKSKVWVGALGAAAVLVLVGVATFVMLRSVDGTGASPAASGPSASPEPTNGVSTVSDAGSTAVAGGEAADAAPTASSSVAVTTRPSSPGQGTAPKPTAKGGTSTSKTKGGGDSFDDMFGKR